MPIRGRCQTTFVNVPPPAPATCDAFQNAPSAFIEISGTCQLSHLGRSTTRAIQQLLFALDSNGSPVLVDGQPVVNLVRNCGVFTAANGDELRHTAYANVTPGGTSGMVALDGGLTFRGGTGAFASAEGAASLTGAANIVTETGGFTLEGALKR
ncbi:MAG: hypothetical protein ACRD1U_19100 [Vicinamibacterales bacterium]